MATGGSTMEFHNLCLDSLRELKPELEKRLPATAMILKIVNLKLSGKYTDGNSVDIYSLMKTPNDEIEVPFFLVLTVKPKFENPFAVIYGPNDPTDEMLQTFTDLFEWSKPYEFGILEQFAPYLEEIVKRKNGYVTREPAADLYLPIDEALKFDVPKHDLKEEFVLDQLTPEHTSKVVDYWKYKSRCDEFSVGDGIKSFGGAIGIFKNTSDSKCFSRSKNNLVSWVVFLHVGTFNALHTLEQYRRRGLATWTMRGASKLVAEQGLIPISEVETPENRKLMEGIGFRYIHDVYWMQYTPGKVLQ